MTGRAAVQQSAASSSAAAQEHPEGIAHWVPRWAEVQPDAPAIISGGAVLLWGELQARVAALAAELHARGVERGDRVACLMHNRVEFLEMFWATVRLGAIFVPLNVRLTVAELGVALEDVEPAVLATENAFADKIPALVQEVRAERKYLEVWSADHFESMAAPTIAELYCTERSAPRFSGRGTDPAAILFTSGTTGRPKGAILSHNNIHAQAANWNISFGCTRRDRQIVFLPLCFTGGLISACMSTFLAGGSLILVQSFDPATVLRLIEQHRATFFTAVPTMVQRLLEHPDALDTDLSSLRLVESGGAPVPTTLIDYVRTLGLELIQGYGLTEGTGGVNLHLQESENIRKAGSCGKPGLYNSAIVVGPDGRECSPGTVGELMLSGPLVFAGYWNNPTATGETIDKGWLHTGDLAYQDDEGFFYLAGRTKEMIISGGLNVYPVEVEGVLRAIPGVADAAVVGLPDEKWGEVVTAYVIPRMAGSLTESQVISACRSSLADYKVPKLIHFRADFPRTTSGKVIKQRLHSDSVVQPGADTGVTQGP